MELLQPNIYIEGVETSTFWRGRSKHTFLANYLINLGGAIHLY